MEEMFKDEADSIQFALAEEETVAPGSRLCSWCCCVAQIVY
jgi:streptolysin S family bacteriocin protoxin